jgi:hypothetical protein
VESKKVEFIEVEKRMVVIRGWRMARGGNRVKGYKVSSRQEE